ncbi:unnamed protein product, partial [Porites evermanni]
MADVLIRSARFRTFLPSCVSLLSKSRHLRALVTLRKDVFEQPFMTTKGSRESLFRTTQVCSSCIKARHSSCHADVMSTSQVITNESTELEKSRKYQALHVMPFSVTEGGKYVAHVLLKHKPKKAIVFVRTRVLAAELVRELEEYGLKCSSLEDANFSETSNTSESENEELNSEKINENDTGSRITVMTEGEVEAMESLLPVDLILLVQQPMTGKSFTLFCLKKAHAKVKPLDVILLYSHNDLAFLSQMQSYVDVKKLSPPSFYNVAMRTEGLPSFPGESTLLPGRHLVEPPPPPITAIIPPKLPRSKVFRPSVSVPVKREGGGWGGGGEASFSWGGVFEIVTCFPNATLRHFSVKENRRILAEHGTYFSGKKGKKQKGTRGRDTVIPVPVGTTVYTDDGQIVREMDELGSRLLVARGGRGGSPATEDWRGEKGERFMIILESRLMADVALVGFPNAGKSSLLRAISNATPKAADYAFTTMRPNIGMVEYGDHSQVSVADLPGLIEGASVNRGLGHRFLKHTQKARALALVVDIDGFRLSEKYPARTAFQNVFILLKELVLYDKELLNRPKILIVTKLDKKGATSRFQELKQRVNSVQEHAIRHLKDTKLSLERQILTLDRWSSLWNIIILSDATTEIVLKVKEFSLEMEKKFDFKPLLTDSQDSQGSTPLRIFSISTAKPENIKFGEEEMDLISGGSDVSSVEEIAQERNENPSHAWTEGNWAFCRDDMDEDLPSFEARYEAMKEIFPSLGENDGRSSRLETLKTPDGSKVAFGEADKNDRDELYAKLREAVDKRVSENLSRLSNPSLVSGDFLSIHENGKPKTAPSSVGKIDAEKQYFFPELRNLIEGRIEETKVDTLANRIERELMRRQHLCNEQALMLQMLMNRVQDLEKRGPPKRGTTPVHTSSRASRGNRCMCYHTSNYIVE